MSYVAAHRGFSRVAPENTLAAFSAALDAGAPALELDVHLTADERIVVIHDDLLERTTSGVGAVSTMTAEQIRRLDAGSWWGPQFAGLTVPFLEEVLELTRGRARLHVELKGERSWWLAGRVVEMVRDFGAVDRTVVMSFDLDAALAAARAGPEIPVLAIVGGRLADQLGFVLATGLAGLNQAPARWESATIERFHERGLIVHGALVNEPADVRDFFDRGGDMVDSDSPDCFASGP